MHRKESKEIIHRCMDIGEHFTREISPEYHIYNFTIGRKRAQDYLGVNYYPRAARQDSEI